MQPFSLNIRGRLAHYDSPAVMGILNVTPDSFFKGSASLDACEIASSVERMVAEGADFIDIGAYSSRPGCTDVTAAEELRRLEIGMKALRDVAPDIPVSVDTFRADVAKEAIKNLSVDIINDISGGTLDDKMHATVAELQVPYILMHMRGNPQNKQEHVTYDNLLADMLKDLSAKVDALNLLGVNDIIVDPGFGFSKTLEQNYTILKHLDVFETFNLPILIGISRKTMITKLLDISPDDALVGTAVLNSYALQHGASILRVHDVAPAAQAIKLLFLLR